VEPVAAIASQNTARSRSSVARTATVVKPSIFEFINARWFCTVRWRSLRRLTC
jgi:hypothetical protein